jgi:hypothetical protein
MDQEKNGNQKKIWWRGGALGLELRAYILSHSPAVFFFVVVL